MMIILIVMSVSLIYCLSGFTNRFKVKAVCKECVKMGDCTDGYYYRGVFEYYIGDKKYINETERNWNFVIKPKVGKNTYVYVHKKDFNKIRCIYEIYDSIIAFVISLIFAIIEIIVRGN